MELCYMTGVLPIAKYSSGSELNMFVEYDMTVMERFSDSFGFVEEETDRLFDIYLKTTQKPKITREDLGRWYDGYRTEYDNIIDCAPIKPFISASFR